MLHRSLNTPSSRPRTDQRSSCADDPGRDDRHIRMDRGRVAVTGRSVRIAWVVLPTLWAIAPQAWAQSAFNLHENTIERQSQAREVSPIAVDTVFGDQISHFDGSVSFSQVDIAVPGNDALPVELRRTLRVEDRSRANGHFLGGFGEWALDLPRLSSEVSVAYGWRPAAGTVSQRCSLPGPLPSSGTMAAEDYWSGYSLQIPGAGGQQLLMNPSGTLPAAGGGPYPWITQDMWRIACKSSTKNGYAGEAFIALSPQGVKYTLDWVVTRTHAPINGNLGTMTSPRQVVHFLVSRIEDRFGNWVDYTYSGDKLTGITASDGRQIALTWSGSNVASVSSSLGTWSYTYASGKLSQVTRPDASKWTFTSTGALAINPIPWSPPIEDPTGCPDALDAPTGTYALSITAPSGAMGQFNFGVFQHMRSNVPEHACQIISPTYWFMKVPRFHWSLTLMSRTVTGPGLAGMTWTYGYGGPDWLGGGNEKENTVAGPGNTWARYTYGTGYNLNEGQWLKLEEGSSAANILQTRSDAYLTTAEASGQSFPAAAATNPRQWSDLLATEWLRPLRQSVTIRQGVSFIRQIPNNCSGKYCFDVFARPTRTIRSSTLTGTPSRTEETSYHDNTAKWVLGQVAQVKCTAPTAALPAGCGASGTVVSAATYDPSWALPLTYSAFGKLQQTLAWDTTSAIAGGQRGTVTSVTDGNGQTTIVSNWKRGIPQAIQHPATPEAPAGATQSAVVNNAGWITSTTDENGYATTYTHDAMGRLDSIAYPTGDSVAWNTTTQAFVQVASAEYGIPAGHWRQTVATGDGRRVVYYDGLWRPLIVREYDTANESGTQRFNRFAYDHRGQVTFAAYPATVYNATLGTQTAYDALGRPTTVAQDSELGTLTTAYAYLAGFQTRVTDPKGNATTTSYLAWDQPTTGFPLLLAHPEGAWTHLTRDAFGKPTRIRRSDSASPTGGTVAVNRDYVYDAYQQLCKSIEPETASTVLDYDGAGNVTWSASGQALPSTSACDRASVAAGHKASRTWDGRNRLTTLSFPDGNGSQAWTYTPDGLPATITTWNDGGASSLVNGYSYNRRRLPTGETQQQTGGPATFTLGYGYDANGHLSLQLYPDGQTVAYTPNALGQPTQAGSYATGVQYFPNGAMKQFTYGNGLTHTLTQNARQLPLRSVDSGDVLDLTWSYDANGNVAAVSDGTTAGRQTRSMGYDGLDRLLTTTSPMYPGGATYAYDVLDNLTRVSVAGRDHRYQYDASNRLTSATHGPGGPVALTLAYDARGNLSNRNGQAFTFDLGNRLRAALGTESYRYDAQGRRARTFMAPGLLYEAYGQAGKLLWQRDESVGFTFQHVYLNGSVVALHRRSIVSGGSGEVVYYWHTDAQGSQVALTVGTTVLQTSEYEPYGKLLNRPNNNRVGYTGHVMDAGTGLTYMQQRYYDPQIGRFLSVDPVTAYGGDNRYFNRYWYAAGNPYRYTDPDGRALDIIADIGFIAYSGYKLATEPSWTNAAALGADFVGAVVPFATGLGAGVRAAAHGADAVKAADGAADAAKPLMGRNPQPGGSRTNTDLGPNGDRASAKSVFRNQAEGKKTTTTMDNGGTRTRADNNVQIRHNPDGSSRVDLPNRGSAPKGESIHTPPPPPPKIER